MILPTIHFRAKITSTTWVISCSKHTHTHFVFIFTTHEHETDHQQTSLRTFEDAYIFKSDGYSDSRPTNLALLAAKKTIHTR